VLRSNLVLVYSLALGIQHSQQATGFAFYQLEACRVVHEGNVFPPDTFLTIFFLFILVNMLIKIIQQMLISIVDTRSFEADKGTEL
jgi:hypothetical protein